jgi:hypothetical protein
MDMRFYWGKYRVKQGQFHVYWGPGYRNLADYFTKHHSLAHHKRMREIYIHASEQPMNRKGIPHCEGVLIPKVRPARTYSIPPWEMSHLPREIEQQAYNLIRITRMCVTSHSQPLINAQHLVTSNKILVNNTK